jgi:Rrf2 family iron-sulfur cluster assembly transcriptional regulator
MFSKACEYGIRATVYIAGHSGHDKRASLKDIAAEIGSPEAFTAKILQLLTRQNIIQAVKGPNGGYSMNREQADKSSLAQLVAAIDGKNVYLDCGLGLKECDGDRPCPLHHKFEQIREGLRDMLENTTISDLVAKLEAGGSYLKR